MENSDPKRTDQVLKEKLLLNEFPQSVSDEFTCSECKRAKNDPAPAARTPLGTGNIL
jgi:hypothetical protein